MDGQLLAAITVLVTLLLVEAVAFVRGHDVFGSDRDPTRRHAWPLDPTKK